MRRMWSSLALAIGALAFAGCYDIEDENESQQDAASTTDGGTTVTGITVDFGTGAYTITETLLAPATVEVFGNLLGSPQWAPSPPIWSTTTPVQVVRIHVDFNPDILRSTGYLMNARLNGRDWLIDRETLSRPDAHGTVSISGPLPAQRQFIDNGQNGGNALFRL